MTLRDSARLVFWSAATLCLFATAAFARPPFESSHRAAFMVETGVGQCSGVAVGPHVLATASHCVGDGLRMVELRGEAADKGAAPLVVEVLTITRDGNDAVLLRLDHRFRSWVTAKRAPLRQGDEVYMLGNPNGLRDLLRRGYYAGRGFMPTPIFGTNEVRSMDTLFLELEATGGDSGSGIFDQNGLLVCMLSGGYVLRHDGFRLTRCHPFKFSKAQWDAARK